MWAALVSLVAFFALASPGARSGTLVVNANSADPTPRAAWQLVVQRFERENPDVRVQFNIYDHESYKKSIRNWLTGVPPDVVFWFAGNRMRQFVTPGLLEDVSDLFPRSVAASMHKSAVDLVSVSGRQYGVPVTYYQIGLYFRKDLLEAAGVPEPPLTWADLLSACDRLKASDVEPIAIGTKELWPAAAWFDYLDLRQNGLAFHMDLMQGRTAYTDARLAPVFERWRQLLDRGCFAKSHVSSTWQESQALLYEGKAAMMLIGNYIVGNFPAAVRDRMDFVRFPTVNPAVGRYEDAPMNTIHIPSKARNKVDARKFLAFMLRADVQEMFNKAMLQIPVNLNAAPADDRFLAKGRDLLARADGLAQYFDRDTSEDLANIAMKGFQEFMIYPHRLEAILDVIERARERVYGPLAAPASSFAR